MSGSILLPRQRLGWNPRAFSAALLTGVTLLFCVENGAAAQACTEPATTVFIGTPGMGAKDVATNVVFYYAIPKHLAAPMPGMFQLHAGSEIIHLQSQRIYADHLELTPEHVLEPNRAHQLEGTWGVYGGAAEALLFWTGDGPYTGPPDPPQIKVQQYRVVPQAPDAPCATPRLGTCIAFGAADAIVEYTLISSAGEEQPAAGAMGALLVNLTGLDEESLPAASCVRLRARGPDGSYSDPLMQCGVDYPVWAASTASVHCDQDGLSWDGMPEEPEVVPAAHETPRRTGASSRASGAGCSLLAFESSGRRPELDVIAWLATARFFCGSRRRACRRRGSAFSQTA